MKRSDINRVIAEETGYAVAEITATSRLNEDLDLFKFIHLDDLDGMFQLRLQTPRSSGVAILLWETVSDIYHTLGATE